MTRQKVIERYKAKLDCKNQKLNGVDLSGLNLRGMSFKGSDLTGCNFNGSNLRCCDLTECTGLDLTSAIFTGAHLKAELIEKPNRLPSNKPKVIEMKDWRKLPIVQCTQFETCSVACCPLDKSPDATKRIYLKGEAGCPWPLRLD